MGGRRRRNRRRQQMRRGDESQWRNNLVAWANADSLAYFVNLGRFVCSAVITLFCACVRVCVS